MVAFEAIHDWVDAPGTVISWEPSAATLAKVAAAPVSAVPVSYQQAQHLHAYRDHAAHGRSMARLNIPSWNIAGQCDVRAMTHVINAYLRRHDTFHSWFEPDGAGGFVRRTLANARDIKFVPKNLAEMAAEQWREHLLGTPDPLQWDCFRFGIIQRSDHFTFYLSVDHVHADAMFMGALFVEIHMMYAALVGGGAPLQLPEAGSYHDYCVRQQEYTSALTVDSPEVQAWIDFANDNAGTLPKFPLPLGEPADSRGGALLTVQLLDDDQTDRFEAACAAAGTRFSGGVFACAAMADHKITGADMYHVITPTTTRSTPAEYMTTGWFTGLVPISVPVAGSSFGAIARAAQACFDSRINLAHVPFERVLELGTEAGVHKPTSGVPMLSYLDAGLPPLSPAIIAEWNQLNGRVFCDAGDAHQIGMWVNRLGRGTTVTVAYPNNPVARESALRYTEAMQAEYLDVVTGRVSATSRGAVPALAVLSSTVG
ncbi:acyltransferase [Mycobacterium sp. TNTM28]|uniref:Acyltransferase n=1 Tax=[Mycobacterium] fortunisiensis TaxID=2600579 RepID=A0ABS6KMZ4_9MYCO|nr:condensation domain-containing protein [[Mycobacterium] fortunisiensis]MBU9764969.1 acyltransferase [[Mycobacterium] fortunisiensis]